MISCTNGPVRVHDTTVNIKATKEFTINMISEPFVEASNITSIDAPANVSEWDVSGLTKAKSIQVKPHRVLESAFSMECELYDTMDVVDPKSGVSTTTVIYGLVKYIHVRNDMLTEKGAVDLARYKAVGRMGDVTYCRIGDGYRIARPFWNEEGKAIEGAVKALDDGQASG